MAPMGRGRSPWLMLFAAAMGIGVVLGIRGARGSEAAAAFTIPPPNPAVGQLVQFRDTTTPPAVTWLWDFGDGTRSSLPNPTHVYSAARRYGVSLNAGGGAPGTGGLATAVVDVSPENTLRFHLDIRQALSGFDLTLAAMDQRTGRAGQGKALARSHEFGYFSIPDLTANPQNPEVFVKVLDARTVNGEFWVFYGGLTDLE